MSRTTLIATLGAGLWLCTALSCSGGGGGGTGLPSATTTSSVSSGVITGFGSVKLNGLEYQTTNTSVTVDGPPGYLKNELQHYSFADLRDQIKRINHYSTLSAMQMYEEGRRTGPVEILVHPPAAFMRNYILRRGFLDGTAGLTISLMNAWSVGLKFMKLWELQRNPKSQIPNPKSQ